MRRFGLLALAAGLVWSVLPVAPAGVGAQTNTITLSLIGSDSNAVTAVGEDGGTQMLRLRATASPAPSSNATVLISTSTTGGATAGSFNQQKTMCTSGDFCVDLTGISVPIAANSTTGTSSAFPVAPRSDTITELHESFQFEGRGVTGYTVSAATLTITDQDRAIKVNVTPDVYKENEGETIENTAASNYIHIATSANVVVGGVTDGVFTVSTSSTYNQNLTYTQGDTTTLRLLVEAGSASVLHTTDYQTEHAQDVWTSRNKDDDSPMGAKINANMVTGLLEGVWTPGLDLRYTIKRDAVVEPDEIFYVKVNAPSGWTSFRTPLTIKDGNLVGFTVDTDGNESGNQDTIAEGADGSGVSVAASFSGATSSVISSVTTVTLSASAETPAGAGKATTADFTYTPSTPNTITFPARSIAPSGTAMLAGLSITDDSVVEGPETFLVGGSSELGDATASTLTIYDNDSDIELEVSPSVVGEKAGTQEITVTARFKGSTSILTEATAVAVTVAGAGGATPQNGPSESPALHLPPYPSE